MTYQSPRIYIYKITFEEVLYYYYGVHKEKKFDEYYMGSPVANKWCWDFYTPKKQILEIFPFTDEGWIEAQEVEKRLIKPVYNEDNWCLNENCGGIISLEISRKNGRKLCKEKRGLFSLSDEERTNNRQKGGKKSAEIHKKNKTGFYGLPPEQRIKNGRKSGNKTKELGIGLHALTPEQRSEIGKKTKELGIGLHALTPEQRSEIGRKSGNKVKELNVGIFAITPEQRSEIGRKSAKTNEKNKTAIYGLTPEQMTENGKKGAKVVNSQKWQCTETGHISTAAGLSNYQKARGIHTSNRRRIS